MKHFSPRSLAFYGGAIVAVTVLFSLATAYGESNLKAPHRIDGRYPIGSSLPGCLSGKPITLLVQQSGVYLTGSLLPTDAGTQLLETATGRPSLTGGWDNQRLQLSGRPSYISGCQNTVIIVGTIERSQLTGTLQLDSSPPVAIAATAEPKKTAQPSTH